MEYLALNNGRKIPTLGLGTWKSKENEVKTAVEAAIDDGYRHFDCAYLYQNENEVGAAFKNKIEQGVVKREDLFITTKLWNTFHKPEHVEPALDASLRNLGLEYVDLYLIHFPTGYKYAGPHELLPRGDDGKVVYDERDYMETWKAMEALLKTGKVKAIGVSNFNTFQLQRICKEGSVRPVVNQVECHPYLNQVELVDCCKKLGVVVVCYSPFGSPDRPWASPDEQKLVDDPVISEIAKGHNRSPAQIILRFLVQRGLSVIPKSVTPSRIKSNSKIFDFILSEGDMQKILKLNRNRRAVGLQNQVDHKYCPFKDNYTE